MSALMQGMCVCVCVCVCVCKSKIQERAEMRKTEKGRKCEGDNALIMNDDVRSQVGEAAETKYVQKQRKFCN